MEKMKLPTNYVCKQMTDIKWARLKMLSTKCVYESYIFNIYL